ncbi:hypothetical protein SDJN02_11003 [Cucurbita argyrosperma subsp. argyrosperma]|nr:hypothetical protein SDJN02_11003 [Cucurbita argyrosperma subsp. argyrosperma]
MAAKFPLSSSLTTIKFSLQQNPSPFFAPLPCTTFSPPQPRPTPRASQFKLLANSGGGDAEVKKGGKKKYWQTAGEREGENPMKTPLPYIIIFGMSTPFVILAIAFANGWVKVPVR